MEMRRPSRRRKWLMVMGGLAVLPVLAIGYGQAQRSAWEQSRAVEMVQRVLRIEESGRPWDKIVWVTDPEEAATRAKREGKPIFVYFYLKKDVGPPEAPC
jgi:hypothetical protein